MPAVESLYYSSHDVADFFYQFRIPRWLGRYFGLRSVKAARVGIARLNDAPVDPGKMLYPCLSVLPMGFSDALHWAQSAHCHILEKAGVMRADKLMVGFHPPPDVASTCGGVVYVDNGIFACCLPGVPEATREKAAVALKACLLPVHEVTAESSELETLGLLLEARQASIRPSRRDRLRSAVRAITDGRKVTGRMIECLLGHFTVSFLLRRPLLSIF